MIADALYEVEGVYDQDLSVDFGSGTVTFSMTVDAADEVRALRTAMTAARSALHAAGGGTPGWEDQYRMARQQIEDTAADGLVTAEAQPPRTGQLLKRNVFISDDQRLTPTTPAEVRGSRPDRAPTTGGG